MTAKDPTSMHVEDLRQAYQDIFAKHDMDPIWYGHQDYAQNNEAVQEVCEAGPEIFVQWLRDNKEQHKAGKALNIGDKLRERYQNAREPDEIASLGAATWNLWQMDAGLKQKKILELHNLSLGNFRGFYFYQPVRYTGEVETDINFSRAVFRKSATFEKVFFNGDAVFEEASFYGVANFNYARFLCHALFDGVRFKERTSFALVDFQGQAHFPRSEFHAHTMFQNTRFKASDTHKPSNYSLVIDDPNNIREIDFTHVRFLSTVDFRRAEFHREVDFSDSLFDKEVRFQGAEFHGKTQFHNCRFHGKTIFDTDEGNLERGDGQPKRTEFFKVPEFYSAELHEGTGILQAKLPSVDGSDESRRAYRTLKLAFSRYQAVREEQFCYRREIMEEQEQLARELEGQTESGEAGQLTFSRQELREKKWRYRFLRIYGCLSDYGFSIVRPAIFLFATFCLSWVLYLILGCMMGHSFSQNVQDAAMISSTYTMPPLVAEWMVRDRISNLFCLVGGSCEYDLLDPSLKFAAGLGYMVLVLQKLFSLLLWFLIFLYWRNLARSK